MPQHSDVVQPLRSQQLCRSTISSDVENNIPFHPPTGLKLTCSSPKNNDSGFDENLTQTGNCHIQQNYLTDMCLHLTDSDSENRKPQYQKEPVDNRRPEPFTFEAPSATYGPLHFDLSTPFVVPPPALLLSTPVLQSIQVLSPAGLFWPPLPPQPTSGSWSGLGTTGQPSVTPSVYDVTNGITTTHLTTVAESPQSPIFHSQSEEQKVLSTDLLLNLIASLQKNVREMVRLSLQRAELNPQSTTIVAPDLRQKTPKRGEESGLQGAKRLSSSRNDVSHKNWLRVDWQAEAPLPLETAGRPETEEGERLARMTSRRFDSLSLSGRENRPIDGAKAVKVNIKTKSKTITQADEAYINKGGLLNGIYLRKAKLMFLYARYPTSFNLKSYFPEVSFTRYNTAQLVKWFSNFR
uniref:Homeobox protein prospero n=1 Tax=Schistocephalus solidus TaxID=70667 RepID=A0A0X3PAF8_SCHSO